MREYLLNIKSNTIMSVLCGARTLQLPYSVDMQDDEAVFWVYCAKQKPFLCYSGVVTANGTPQVLFSVKEKYLNCTQLNGTVFMRIKVRRGENEHSFNIVSFTLLKTPLSVRKFRAYAIPLCNVFGIPSVCAHANYLEFAPKNYCRVNQMLDGV